MDLLNVPTSLIMRKCTSEAHEKELPNYRTEFMRDRDRIMYATAFRRLAGKTQIYTVGADDHKRNRLTHTLEVSQIARTVSTALGLNSDLAEAIALAHDFGHTPFGHAGERMLHDIMIPESDYIKNSPFYKTKASEIEKKFEREKRVARKYCNYAYGFKHNLQSMRVTTVLEDSYRSKDGKNIGLNLTNFTLYGMIIHSKIMYDANDKYPNYYREFENYIKIKDCEEYAWSIEAYIVKMADEFAQWHHDLEDAMRGGALPIETISKNIKESLKMHLSDEDITIINRIVKDKKMDRKTIAELSHIVINTLVNSMVETTQRNMEIIKTELQDKGIDNAETVFRKYDDLSLSINKDSIVCISDDIDTSIFEGLIRGSVHHSRNVERMNEKGKYIIRKLFEAYYTHPQQLPDGPILHLLVDIGEYKTIDKVRKMGIGTARVRFEEIMKNPNIHIQCVLMRRICDHIASMTDRYAIDEYNNLYG